VPRIDRHSIGAGCVVVAAMLEALLPAFVAMRAQALQLASLEFHRMVVMRLDVVGDACSNDLPSAKHIAQRLFLQLTACASMPLRFVVQPSHR
jgi:hypothetical protein